MIEAGDGEAAFAALRASGEDAARAIDDAFVRAGASLAGSLTRAAADGKVTLDELASAALRVFEALARSGGGSGGLGDALAKAVSAGFGGARADGGFAAAGGAFLVGERGPEVFRPAASGVVEPIGGAAPVTVNVTVAGGAEALLRSEAQLAGLLARAVSVGARRG
jgi:hypothetical protein